MSSPSTATLPLGTENDIDDLSEQQLREFYENEEMDRFLTIFSTYVTEVRVLETSSGTPLENTSVPTGDSVWVIGQTQNDRPTEKHSAQNISEQVANQWIRPHLPPSAPPAPPFTLGRLKLAVQRLYLATIPIYVPFLVRMHRLSSWRDTGRSSMYCIIFWILWYHDLLCPAFFLRILYALIRRRILPYPTIDELRERLHEVDRANKLGDAVSSRLSASSSFGVRDMWRLFRIVNKPLSKPRKSKAKKASAAQHGSQSPPESIDYSATIDAINDEPTVLDDETESQEERDIKRLGLHILNAVADFHERMKNLFIWRRHCSSRIYGAFIFCTFLATLLLPARIIAKCVYFVVGFLFWHVMPVIMALSPQERARLPPPLANIPTDAEYAMELISSRIASGKYTKPGKKTDSRSSDAAADSSVREGHDEVDFNQMSASRGKDTGPDWKKWSERAAVGKAWAGEGKRLMKGQWMPDHTSPIIPSSAIAIAQPTSLQDTHTFVSQHSTTPGLITLTSTMFLFTPLTTTKPKITLPLSRLRGVRKMGLIKGLSLKWSPENDEHEVEEIFRWVGGRDELFTRLVGLAGKRWKTS
ncbi:hypothetical protein ARMGADRAFT_1073433 [Armillaria gallica]|uniref:Uncharacterized protein n=1 Tax=Armillaria gallica TaxID=47427 RepID=A0A2H3EDI8_ARMGA|nr:hypothetical protein ARMGADRAFT_1073433 [Armillaria gallica]